MGVSFLAGCWKKFNVKIFQIYLDISTMRLYVNFKNLVTLVDIYIHTARFKKNVWTVLTNFPIDFRNKWYLIWKPNKGPLEWRKNWGWHHPEDGQAPLTEKAQLLLELVWSLSRQRFFQFQYCFQTARYRAFFWGI